MWMYMRLLCEFPEALQGNDGTQGGERRQESLSLFPHLVALLLHTFCIRLRGSLNVTCGRVQLRRGGETASFLKELVFDIALWCRHRGSVGRSNQENDYGAHKDCRFCWSKTFGWGDIRTSNSVSPIAMTVACQSAQLAQLGYEREDGFPFRPPLLPVPWPPPPILYKTMWICWTGV